MKILYEDNHLIAVEKRPGQLTQGDATGDVSVLEEVRGYIKKRDNKPGNVFIGLLHRLDRPVGGVLLLAKTSKGASRISQQIRERHVEKIYEALVEGQPPKHGYVSRWLKKDPNRNFVRAYDKQVTGSLFAELEYQRISGGEVSRVEIHPITGRPHQIRVAMASLHTPIVGDTKYGAKKRWAGQLALWAKSFTFAHPISQEIITVTSEPVWKIDFETKK